MSIGLALVVIGIVVLVAANVLAGLILTIVGVALIASGR